MLVVAVWCGFLLMLTYDWWRSRFGKSLPPRYPGALPLIGNAHQLIGDGKHLWKVIQDVQRFSMENDGVVYIQMGPQINYIICDPDDYIEIMDTCLEKNYWYRKILGTWVGQGLVTASVPVWKLHQKLLYPSFSQHVVDSFAEIHNRQARGLVQLFSKKKGPFDPTLDFSQCALEANFQTAFGLELNEDNINQMQTYISAFIEVMKVMTERIQNVWMHSDLIYSCTELKKRQLAALKITKRLSEETIERKREALKNKQNLDKDGNVKGKRLKGFMDLILELSEGGLLSNEEITWQVDTMILAGYDTSSTTAVYACMLLGSYPEVQEEVYREIQELLGDTDRDLDRKDLSKLKYLQAVLNEVGRLYPAAPVVTRYVEKDVQLKNYTMPAGSDCAVMISGLNRHKMWGPDSEEFRPERWLDPTTLPKYANSFTGFSTGRRACIGKLYALSYMKITLIHLLRNYRIVADHTKMALQIQIFLKPAEGCYITLVPRHEVKL